jgi:TRAP-type C4-dicarboxylate transport system permease small subunit
LTAMANPDATNPDATNLDAVRLPKVASALDRLSTSIARICAWVIAAMLFVMLFAVTLQVIGRYWIHFLVGGPEELARLSMVTMVFLGLPVLARYSEHIRLDVANELIPNATLREWIARCALFIELVFLTTLAVLAFEFVSVLWHSQQLSPALGLRIFWSRLPVFIGTGLAAIVCACVLARRLLGAADVPDDDLHDELDELVGTPPSMPDTVKP